MVRHSHAFPLVPVGDVCTISRRISLDTSRCRTRYVHRSRFIRRKTSAKHRGVIRRRENPADIKSLKIRLQPGDVLTAKLTASQSEQGMASGATRDLLNRIFVLCASTIELALLYAYSSAAHDFNDAVAAQMSGRATVRIEWIIRSRSKSPSRRWRCRRRSWRRSRATRKSSTAPAPSSTTTAPTSPSTPTGRWWS